MYCNKCGIEVQDGVVRCDNCGATTESTIKRDNSVSYDYKTVDATQKTAIEIADCYEALGWELANKNDSYLTSAVTLNFKRSRKIKNKDQLNRLQVKLDDSINGISVLESRKTKRAIVWSLVIGIIGSLLFGAGMCFCMPDVLFSSPEIWVYIVGGVFAAVGAGICLLGYLAYCKIRKKDTNTMNNLIDKKRDEISQTCEDAQRLLV